MTNPSHTTKTGIVLSGGGARGAYQAGVLKGIAELCAGAGIASPFNIISGCSAGSINAAFLAANIHRPKEATDDLVRLWSGLRTSEIFRTDVFSLSRIAGRLITDVLLSRLRKKKKSRSLLNTNPLRDLVEKHIPFDQIRQNIDSGLLDALTVTATDYSTSESTSFVMAKDPTLRWKRERRKSTFTDVSLDHVMASAAIPLFFPAYKIGDSFYGDGCLRNQAPLSPAIHLGADRLLVIGVKKKPDASSQPVTNLQPTIGRIISVLLNSIMMDNVEYDIERLSRVNRTIAAVPTENRDKVSLRSIDCLFLRPSVDLGKLAARNFDLLPETIKYLVGGLGNPLEASELISYLMFEAPYCEELARIGHQDALQQSEGILQFLLNRSQG